VIPSLAQLLVELGSAVPGATSATADGTTTWSRGGRAFCIAGPLGVELRLDKPIAAAATRTPDAAPSPRGLEWVRFNPRELDGHAVDRVTAWFELAYRLAEP
jgi:hypothetical protein